MAAVRLNWHLTFLFSCLHRELKEFLQGKGYVFVSETDTECIAKLIQYLYDQDETKQKSFRQLVEEVRCTRHAFLALFLFLVPIVVDSA